MTTDGSQEFCLRWNNHQATIISVFDYLLENETLVDCTLAAEGQYLKAHKVVLCACSPYLELLLSQHNDKHPILIFKDIKFNELKSMIDYMYKGEVNIAQDQLNHFLKAAESLQIKGLSESEDDATPQTATPTPRPPPPRAPPAQRTQPRPFNNAVAIRSTGPSDVDPDSPKRIIGRPEAQSPTPRKRRRQAPVPGRPSLSGDDASNASEGHFDQSNCDVPTPAHSTSTSLVPSGDSEKAVAKVETNSELMLEPKTEYDDNSVEDITLDDDDEDYSQAGTSQMDNSQGNFGNWQQMVGDQTGDDVFSGQDTGAQNSQDKNTTSNSELNGKERSPTDNSKSDISKENVIEEVKNPVKTPKKLKLSERVQFYASNLSTENNNIKHVESFKHCDERNTSDIKQNTNHFEQAREIITTSGDIQRNTNHLYDQAHERNTTSRDDINQNTDDLFEQNHKNEINDTNRDNFTEINQLLQIDQSQLLELHPEIDNIELSDINTTTLPEIPEESTTSSQESSGTRLSIEESIDREHNNVNTIMSISKDNRFDNLNIPDNIGGTSKKSEFININDLNQTKAAKGNVNQIPSGRFDDYMQATCTDESEKIFLHNLVWSPEKMTNTIQHSEYNNSKDSLNSNVNSFKKINCGDKTNVLTNTSKLIDLNSPVVLCENSSLSFNIPSDQTQFNILNDSSAETTSSTSSGSWNQMIILMADEDLSTVTVDNMEEDKPTLTKPDTTEPKKTKQVEPMKGRYFKSKFRIDLESKEYVVCTFCNEKISVELNEVVLHCKTCVHIVRKKKYAKFRFGCFACDYKSNQLSHLKRHLSAHLKYVPK